MQPSLHAVDLIRKTRDGEPLDAAEIHFLVAGAAAESIPEAQLAAWLMAVFHKGLTLAELGELCEAMRWSGETFDARDLGRAVVDKHSTGGVGDKTSLIVAPIAAAAGLLDPMISGRALGHTGGTLDKLETIPGFRTSLSLAEMRTVLAATGACMAGQSARLVPADRTLYSLRDRTATVESPYLICASIMSKKLAAGLDGLILDVKTGSGAFLRDPEAARFLARLMVETGERAGTKTVAVLSDMSQPLGESAGNWIEVAECCALLQGERSPMTQDLRNLSLVLAGWMLFLGGGAPDAEQGYRQAERLLESGAAWQSFRAIVSAQGGDLSVLDAAASYHAPGARLVIAAKETGFLNGLDTTAFGWAVQRLGAGRVEVGDAVDAHAGLTMHVKLGQRVEQGKPVCTLFAAEERLFAEPTRLLEGAVTIEAERREPPPLIAEVITALR
ncbi:thymidine phosphorylase [Acidipila sp. EB88]|uniref:thymidine phosphorylase n=1 Tax=Acidipila sp. EB88 TaxID=2305226 RepID=UPI000F5FFF30|nr:thymidine phosphorylase [Acidipila sp. EB88]RRA48747.1 thymidine phosphorylase [Acidipila sp. EB88]